MVPLELKLIATSDILTLIGLVDNIGFSFRVKEQPHTAEDFHSMAIVKEARYSVSCSSATFHLETSVVKGCNCFDFHMKHLEINIVKYKTIQEVRRDLSLEVYQHSQIQE